jgi:hypothetical protein
LTVEFKGDLPNWNLKFSKPAIPLSETDEFVKIDGQAFVAIQFSLVPYPEESPPDFVLDFPKEKLKLSVINEIKNSEFFEGYLSFAVGFKSKTLYRERELRNPSRLLIDFKN